jgi:hypothetical protein
MLKRHEFFVFGILRRKAAAGKYHLLPSKHLLDVTRCKRLANRRRSPEDGEWHRFFQDNRATMTA